MKEFPLIQKKWTKNINSVDIVFPNKYHGGIYSLGMLILYNIINSDKNWICNRVFLDKNKLSSKLIGFSFQYELDYYNILKMLSGKLDKNKRKEIVFAGGPVINTNPYILQEYLDFVVLGESEETMQEVMANYDDNKNVFLKNIADIKGVYVPGLSNKPNYRFVKNLDNVHYPIYQPMPEDENKKYVFGKPFILETDRGCSFKCKFCALPKYYKNVKIRSLKKIKEITEQGLQINKRKKVVIYSASFTHPKRKEILQFLFDKNVEYSVPSTRVEMLDEEIVELIVNGGQKTLTLAPETEEKMRFDLGKRTKDELFFNVIDIANRKKVNTLKYYFLFGLPGQEKKDLIEMVKLMKKLKMKFNGKSHFSLNPLISKPGSEFVDEKFNLALLKNQSKFLKKEMNKENLRFKISNLVHAKKEYELSRKNFQT